MAFEIGGFHFGSSYVSPRKSKLEEGFLQLKLQYPALYSSAETAQSKIKKKASGVSAPIIKVLPSSTSTSTIRKPIDLSSSKLSLLDNPNPDPTPLLGKRKVRAMKKAEREKTKGPRWYGMTAPEMTDERKNDLEALRMRSALDSKRFYKRNTVTVKPKYFQVGKVIETKANFYNSRLTKKQRKRTLAEELMAELQ